MKDITNQVLYKELDVIGNTHHDTFERDVLLAKGLKSWRDLYKICIKYEIFAAKTLNKSCADW